MRTTDATAREATKDRTFMIFSFRSQLRRGVREVSKEPFEGGRWEATTLSDLGPDDQHERERHEVLGGQPHFTFTPPQPYRERQPTVLQLILRPSDLVLIV
jgi:hypothetical protein